MGKMLNVDLTQAGDNPGENTKVPPGMHPAVLVKFEVKAPKSNPDGRMCCWTFRFPQHDDRELIVFNTVGGADKNTWLASTLKALGIPANKAGATQFDPDLLIGKKVVAKVAHEDRVVSDPTSEHHGKTFTDDKIKLVYPPEHSLSNGASSGGGMDLSSGGGSASAAAGGTAANNLLDLPF